MNAQPQTTDNELLQSMLAGNEGALAELYGRRHHGIYRFALQMCGSKTIAEDITQEVFLVLIHHGQTFDPARGSLSGFLMGVARNHVLRRLQRERFYVPLDESSDNGAGSAMPLLGASGPLEDLSRAEAIESVRKAVLALPERYREVVVLCDLEELSYAETAEVIGCAVGTVRSRLHRARALLITKLRPKEKQAATAEMNSKRCFA